MHILITDKNTLIFENFEFKCCVGKHGFTKNKKEGDKKTPKGIFSLGNLFYRKDKFKKPNSKFKKISITKTMGWCDDPRSLKYNKLIKISKNIGHERLFKKDSSYDYLIPINYNMHRPLRGKGSAIFLHLTKSYKPTAGCIALKKNDFLILLKLITKKTKIKII